MKNLTVEDKRYLLHLTEGKLFDVETTLIDNYFTKAMTEDFENFVKLGKDYEFSNGATLGDMEKFIKRLKGIINRIKQELGGV